MKKILVVDDDPIQQRLVRTVLDKVGGYKVVVAEDGLTGLGKAAEHSPDAVLLDIQLPDLGGMEVLRKLTVSHPAIPIIMLTANTDVKTAVEAIKTGAYDYLVKPFESDHLLITLARAIEKGELITQVRELRQRVGKGPALSRLSAKSSRMQEALGLIQKVAASNLTVLIQGETGTGKELAARALHEESPRGAKPFVALDCGALAENLLESELFGHEKGSFTGADRKKEGQLALAEGGTLFLDEVGNLPLGLQAKLLRVLQERQFKTVGGERTMTLDVRFVAATNVKLEEEVKAGRFRQDLYFRLAEFTVPLPPLRERQEDLPFLVQRFREEASVEFQRSVNEISGEAAIHLMAHDWPGNVRELRNVIRQAVLLTPGSTLDGEQVRDLLKKSAATGAVGPLEVPLPSGASLKQISQNAVLEVEKQAIRNVLRSARGNQSQAAKFLKTDYKTLHRKIVKYGIPFQAE